MVEQQIEIRKLETRKESLSQSSSLKFRRYPKYPADSLNVLWLQYHYKVLITQNFYFFQLFIIIHLLSAQQDISKIGVFES